MRTKIRLMLGIRVRYPWFCHRRSFTAVFAN